MQEFDVVIVGAGPAGGHCARLLAQSGQRVLLVEQAQSFDVNSFSSAGAPLDILKSFNLPERLVGQFWRNITIVTTNLNEAWRSPAPLGVVLDFARLREFLAQEAQRQGATLWLGHHYLSRENTADGKAIAHFQQRGTGDRVSVCARVIVDATGPARAVVYAKRSEQPPLLSATGIEYLIEVSPEIYDRYRDDLTFFLGHRWMPRGYSWIFPMAPNQLKVGAAYIKDHHALVQQTQSLRHYIDLVLREYMHLDDYRLIESHGSTIRYSRGLEDRYYDGSTCLAIGDAVSTIYLLGGDGFRHAMEGAAIAHPYILQALQNPHSPREALWQSYQQAMLRRFKDRWLISERLGLKKYLADSDEAIDSTIRRVRHLSAQELVDILFYYKFERLTKGFNPYLLNRLYSLFKRIRALLPR